MVSDANWRHYVRNGERMRCSSTLDVFKKRRVFGWVLFLGVFIVSVKQGSTIYASVMPTLGSDFTILVSCAGDPYSLLSVDMSRLSFSKSREKQNGLLSVGI